MESIQQELVQKALLLGMEYEVLTAYGSDYLLLTHQGREVLFGPEAVPLNQITFQSYFETRNKQYCKRLLDRVGIPHPKSMVFKAVEAAQEQLKVFMQPNKQYVCKPLDGTEGKGVQLNCTTLDAVAQAVAEGQQQYGYEHFMLEEQVEGSDLRLQAVGGKLVAACRREPAAVVGDGTHTLEALMAARQAFVQQQNPANDLVVDAITQRLLQQQGLQLTDVPAAGQKVQLKEIANMNQGAMAYDITDAIHPTYSLWIERLAEALQQRVFALDLLTTDYTVSPTDQNTWAIEINGESYWLHHTFSEGRTHDIATLILKDTFDLA